MKTGCIVVRQEKHIDDKYWICDDLEDALIIAKDIVKYWKDQYDGEYEGNEIDETLYHDLEFHYDMEDCFRVSVRHQEIRSKGETESTNLISF